MISNTYEMDNLDNLDNVHRQLNMHFSKDEQLKIAKKNIIKICFTDILAKFCFTIQNNDIVLDYRYFKFVSASENHEIIIQYIISIIKNVLKLQETFTFHVNMSSITLLHIEKYFGFIKNISEILKVTFPDKLNVCYVYNAPFIFSKLFNIVSSFIDKKTQQKIKLVKDE